MTKSKNYSTDTEDKDYSAEELLEVAEELSPEDDVYTIAGSEVLDTSPLSYRGAEKTLRKAEILMGHWHSELNEEVLEE